MIKNLLSALYLLGGIVCSLRFFNETSDGIQGVGVDIPASLWFLGVSFFCFYKLFALWQKRKGEED